MGDKTDVEGLEDEDRETNSRLRVERNGSKLRWIGQVGADAID